MASIQHYIFVDESGDPGKPFTFDSSGNKIPTGSSLFYILSAVCLDSTKLFKLEQRFLEIKNEFEYIKEIKSSEISLPLHEKLLTVVNNLEIQIYYRLIDKAKYKGKFAVTGDKKLHNIFDEYNLAKVVKFAVKKCGISESELVIDRTDRRLLDNSFDNFNQYLMSKVNTKTLKKVKNITHVSSEYVHAMQLSDIVNGALKDYFTGKNKDLRKIMNKKFLYKIF
jgi:hypothetical protein